MNVLVLGGYGYFGSAIAAALAKIPPIRVVVAGRDAARARQCAARIGCAWLAIDADDGALDRGIAAAGAGLVVNTVGPFQSRDYRVARAALAAGAHYVDIADARAFVCGVTALDAEARAADRLAVAGASSVPALSSAVIDRYRADFSELHEIDAAISSSARVPGEATLASVLGYCGRPFTRWEDGAWRTVYGCQGLRSHRFADPAMSRWVGDCDVPDLELFPERYAGVRSVRFGAGVELVAVQWGVRALATLVRRGVVRDAARWTPLLARLARMLEPLGSGRSAMYVRLRGLGPDGRALERCWEITAAGDDGRMIPCAAAIALARKLAGGACTLRGALPCVGLVSLPEYLRELDGFQVDAHGCGPELVA